MAHPVGIPGQGQERGLERVIGRVRVAKQPPADAQDHRPVPFHQLGERGPVVALDEAAQKHGVGRGVGDAGRVQQSGR